MYIFTRKRLEFCSTLSPFYILGFPTQRHAVAECTLYTLFPSKVAKLGKAGMQVTPYDLANSFKNI